MIDVNKVIAYESGEMGEDEVIEFFQELVNLGMAWQLQGHYGRTAKDMLYAGLILPANEFAARVIRREAAQQLADEGNHMTDPHMVTILKNRLKFRHGMDVTREEAEELWMAAKDR